jgi:hypothetical protein
MAVNYAFPTDGMMGPSTPIDRITAKSSMFGPGMPTPGEQVAKREELKRRVKESAQRGAEGAQNFLGRYGKYAVPAAALAVGVMPSINEARQEIEAGRPLGALGGLAPALLSTAGAGMLGRTGQAMIGKGGVVGSAIGLGLMGLGAILPGVTSSAASSAYQSATGKPTKGKEGEFSTQMAINKQLAELGTTQYRDNMGVYISAVRDLSSNASNQAYLDLQRNIPLLNQMKNADLTRQQALLNTQNQAYMQQGVVATAGSLALGAQQNTAQLMNTALQTNPYASATLQAPQIRFG